MKRLVLIPALALLAACQPDQAYNDAQARAAVEMTGVTNPTLIEAFECRIREGVIRPMPARQTRGRRTPDEGRGYIFTGSVPGDREGRVVTRRGFVCVDGRNEPVVQFMPERPHA